MNKTFRTTTIALTLGAGLGLASTAHAYGFSDFFAPVPGSIRQALSGISLSTGTLHQDYSEVIGDTQKGDISQTRLAFDGMGAHFGLSTRLTYAGGHTTYNGYVENLQTGATSPVSGSTKSSMFDTLLTLRAGFSPLPRFAVIPDAFLGYHIWDRNNDALRGGYDETYGNAYSGFGVRLAVDPIDALVLSAKYQSGHTSVAKMTSNISGDTANLGSKPWTRYGLEVDYTPWSHLTVFAAADYTKFKYGRSQTITLYNGDTGYEPDSTTKQTSERVGVRVRF